MASTVRVRTTAGAVGVVGVALLLGAVTLVLIVRSTLTENVRAAAETRAGEVAAVLAAGGDVPSLAVGEPDEQLIQILDEDGRVVAASENVAGRAAVARPAPGEAVEVHTPVDEDLFLAVAANARMPDGRRTVVVARALSDALESTQVLVQLLAVGLPLLLVVVGVTTWRVVGRALAPVAAIGGEVDAISAAELHRRVPEPASGDEIARLARTMNRMLARLQGAQSAQRRFVSDASHELRTPTASIRQHTEVARAYPDRVTVAGLAEPVHAEALRLQRLIDDLLLLARADEAGLALRRVQVDVDDLVLAEADRVRRALSVDTSGVTAGRVLGDPAGLRRVLRNLADNAARHASSAVAFGIAVADGSVTVTVDDDGPGIPAAERTRVLDRFVRLADARARDEGGSGLGLAIVAELVAAHGGTVAIADAPLGGARVAVTLPGVQD
ncbi:MAG: sensor histidine kinase [Actinophytocola sp.]|uniref:sensor histidine kinase n=1 Tax=Actinophytocola sp. TaxID=1872138 RepID=UPI003D6A76E1